MKTNKSHHFALVLYCIYSWRYVSTGAEGSRRAWPEIEGDWILWFRPLSSTVRTFHQNLELASHQSLPKETIKIWVLSVEGCLSHRSPNKGTKHQKFSKMAKFYSYTQQEQSCFNVSCAAFSWCSFLHLSRLVVQDGILLTLIDFWPPSITAIKRA